MATQAPVGVPPTDVENQASEKSSEHVGKLPTGVEPHHVTTKEKVPGHDNYYERDGLRTDGDSEDHEHEPPMTFNRFMALVAMALLWTGSQIPVYLYGGCPPYIYGDIGGTDRWVWFIIANLLALAAICPFVGSLSDLIGRRYVALIGGTFLVVGNIVCATSKTMNIFIAGQVLNGVGAGINELTALAATSEIAPTRKRGIYVSALIFTIIPFVPSVLYAQLISYYATWRYIGIICGVWAALGVLLTAIFYFPPPRVNSKGYTRAQILAEIDWLGGLLSISGIILFIMGLQWGGYQYPWSSGHVLGTLIPGFILIVAFIFWQNTARNKHPIFPRRLRQDPRILGLTLVITAVSGANFFSILMFWPTQAFNTYDHDPVGVGLRGLPVGIAIMFGCCIVLCALSILRGHVRSLMIASTIVMTVGCALICLSTPYNMDKMWIVLIVAGLGIGGILVPASIISTIVCPDDLIATVSALTLSIRVLGGAIGYAVYYNVFSAKFKEFSTKMMVPVIAKSVRTTDKALIGEIITATSHSMLEHIHHLPAVMRAPGSYEAIVKIGREAFAESYKYVYYVSIAFGVVSVVAACFLGDISKYMDDHVAVVIH